MLTKDSSTCRRHLGSPPSLNLHLKPIYLLLYTLLRISSVRKQIFHIIKKIGFRMENKYNAQNS